MFSNNKSKDKSTSTVNSIPSILAKGLAITGDITSDGELQIDGIITGNIRAEKLTVGETAHISGDIDAGEILIRGKIDGNIKAVDISILSTGMVKGDVINSSLNIEPGAIVDGHCKHSDNPREVTDPIALFDKDTVSQND